MAGARRTAPDRCGTRGRMDCERQAAAAGETMAPPDEDNLFCHRCGAILTPGQGNFYVVRIEAVADPTPPTIAAEDLESPDPSGEIDRLLREIQDTPEQELTDQVCRRLTIHLCGSCYRQWIEDPAR